MIKRGILIIFVSFIFVSMGFVSSLAVDCSNVIGLWHLDGKVSDSSGSGNDGVNNGQTFVSGKFGQAASFTPGSYIERTDASISGGVYSFSFWINPSIQTDNYPTIVRLSNSDNNGHIWIYFYNNSKSIALQYKDTSGVASTTLGQSVSIGAWNHFGITFNENTGIVSFTKNGATPITVSLTITGSNTYNNILINRNYNTLRYSGLIDEFIIYNKILTPTEITELYTTTSAVSCGTCIPKTCSDLAKTCGNINDGCGLIISCGVCTTGEICSNGNCIQQSNYKNPHGFFQQHSTWYEKIPDLECNPPIITENCYVINPNSNSQIATMKEVSEFFALNIGEYSPTIWYTNNSISNKTVILDNNIAPDCTDRRIESLG